MSDRTVVAVVLGLTAFGGLIRAYGVGMTGAPLNDGGLFYQMVLDLERSWPSLPEVTSYNRIDAPFAYPPLAFYVATALHGVLGMDVMRFIPLAAAILTVPALFLLARSVTGSALYAMAAAGVFALMPRSFEWMTMGGGLTRAPGLLLAIVALWLTSRVVAGAGWPTAVWAGIAGGAVALTHPQAALFTVLSGVVLASEAIGSRTAVVRLGAAVGMALLLVLPWLLLLVARDDLSAIASASGTQPGPFIGLLSLLAFEVTGSRLFDVTGFLAAVGLVISVVRGRWRLPVWLVVLMVLDARGGATYAAVPASMLAAVALVDVLVRPFWEPANSPEARPRLLRRSRALVVGVIIAVGIVDGLGSQLAPTWPAVALSAEQRDAIREAGEVAPDGRFLVVSGRFWAVDATAEWFPTLSGTTSVATVQGYEWLGRGAFVDRVIAAEELRGCANAGDECLHDWAATWDVGYTHVFIPKGSLSGPWGEADCCTGLRLLLRESPHYAVTYDGAGATIFERMND